MLSEPVILAIIAVSSPIIVGVVKELLGARKIRAEGVAASLQTSEKQNEFLHKQLEEFRKYHEDSMDKWRDRYEKLRDKFDAEREKVIRLETRHEFRNTIRKGRAPKRAEREIDFLEEFRADMDAIVFADAKGCILEMNPKAHVLFGYIGEDVRGEPLTILMPERYHKAHNEGLKRLAESGESQVTGKIIQVECLTSDGERFDAELSVRTFMARGKRYFAGVFRRKFGDDDA